MQFVQRMFLHKLKDNTGVSVNFSFFFLRRGANSKVTKTINVL